MPEGRGAVRKGETVSFLYETHLHTCEASACGKTPGREYISFMMGKGYSGMIVTDHFFNGNSCVPRDLPWEERVNRYCLGYEHAFEAAKGTDFSVFFGIEFNFEGDEFLLYGVGKDWLLAHPGLLAYSRQEVYAAVHEGGGIMIQAHPYRERDYLDSIHLTPGVCDGIEVFNAGNKDYMNALALRYAQELGLPMTAGSDIHHTVTFETAPMGGMQFEEKLTSVEDYAQAVIAGKGTPVVVYPYKVLPVSEVPEQCTISKQPTLPVYWH